MKKFAMGIALVLGLSSVAVAQDAPKGQKAKTEQKSCCKKEAKGDQKSGCCKSDKQAKSKEAKKGGCCSQKAKAEKK